MTDALKLAEQQLLAVGHLGRKLARGAEYRQGRGDGQSRRD